MDFLDWLMQMAQRNFEATEPGREDRRAASSAATSALGEAYARTDAFFANADRASWGAGNGSQYDPSLRQADVYRERGAPPLAAEALGLATEFGNPDPFGALGDFAKVAGGAAGLAAMGPRMSVDSRMVAELAHRLRGSKRPPVFGDAAEGLEDALRILDDPEVYGAAPNMIPRFTPVEDGLSRAGYQPHEVPSMLEQYGFDTVFDLLRDSMPSGYEDEIRQYLSSFGGSR